MSVRSNFIWNTSYQVVRILTPLITTPYLTRVLGSDALGTYSYTYTIAMYFTYFCQLGLSQYGNREIAKARKDEQKLPRVFTSIFVMQASFGAIVSIFYAAFALFMSGNLRPLMAAWAIWVLAEAVDISWFFYGIEDFRKMTIRNLLVRLLVIVSIFIFIKCPDDLPVYCLLQALAFGLNSWILWVMLKGRVRFVRVTAKEVIAHIKPNLLLFAPVIAISCYTQLNKLFLGFFAGMSEVAYYDNADKIVVIPLAVIQSLGTVMLPRMSNVVSAGDEGSASRYLSLSSWLSQAMAFGLMFGIAGVAQEFVPVFFGEGFERCATLMPLLSLIIPICAWSNVLGVQYLIPHERDREYLVSVVAGAIVNIGMCLLLIPSYGAFGAAVSTVVAEMTVSVAQSIFSRFLPLGSFLRDVAPFVIAGLCEMAVARGLGALLGCSVLGLVGEIAIAGFAYVLVSLLLLAAKRDRHLKQILRKQ